MKAIYFDMDGTIADLYGVENWETKLRSEDSSPYREAAPLVDMDELTAICEELAMLGITIGVISWLAMNSSRKYDNRVRSAKYRWIKKHFNVASEIHIVKYGTPKHDYAKIKNAILVDDSEAVRDSWNGETVDATKDIIKELKELLARLQ